MNTKNQSNWDRLELKLIALFLLMAGFVAAFLLTHIAAAGAQTTQGTCTGMWVDFEGTRLLNLDDAQVSGPRLVNLEAGLYDVTLISSDETHLTYDDPAQTNEQWFLVWDDGFQVGPTADLLDEVTVNTTKFFNVEAPATVELYALHARVGDSINSVDPLAVCLELQEPEEPAPTTTVVPEEPADPTPTTVTPEEPAEPSTTTVSEPVEDPTPTTQVGEPVEPVVPAEPVEPEIPMLAVTGPADNLWAFGAFMLIMGFGFIGASGLFRRDS